MPRRTGLVLVAPLRLLPWLVFGGAPLDEARALLTAYHEDPARIDRARDILAAAVAEPTPETLIALARAWFLVGEFRATAAEESRLRETTDTILELNPASVEAWILAGRLAANVPGFLGGDRVRAEKHFRRALTLDPHRTGARLELARLYLAAGRDVEARAELERLIAETAPTDRPYWTLRDVPAARALLEKAAGGASGR
jgi:tetratricopeptide (TPR) repeat protein